MIYINIKDYIIISLIFLLLLASGGVLHIYFGEFLSLLFLLLLCLLFYKTTSLKIKSSILKQFGLSELFFLALLSINYFSSSFANDLFIYISLFFRLSIVNLFVLYVVNFRIKMLKYLYEVLVIIICLSLINFLFSFLIIQYTTQKSDFVTLKTIIYIFNYASEAEFLGFNFFRNQSIFWEPGILAVFMNFFVLLSFIYKKINFWFYASVIIIFTTFSTTGLFIFFCQIMYFLVIKKSTKSFKFLGLPFLVVFCLYFLIPNIINKTSGNNVASFDLRTFDFFNACSILINYPFWGIGLDPGVYLKIYDKYQIFDLDFTYDVYREIRGNTNSIIMVFVNFGILNGLLFYFIFFNKVIFGVYSNIFYFITIISLFSEPLIFSNFFLLIPLFAFYKHQFYDENSICNTI